MIFVHSSHQLAIEVIDSKFEQNFINVFSGSSAAPITFLLQISAFEGIVTFRNI